MTTCYDLEAQTSIVYIPLLYNISFLFLHSLLMWESQQHIDETFSEKRRQMNRTLNEYLFWVLFHVDESFDKLIQVECSFHNVHVLDENVMHLAEEAAAAAKRRVRAYESSTFRMIINWNLMLLKKLKEEMKYMFRV